VTSHSSGPSGAELSHSASISDGVLIRNTLPAVRSQGQQCGGRLFPEPGDAGRTYRGAVPSPPHDISLNRVAVQRASAGGGRPTARHRPDARTGADLMTRAMAVRSRCRHAADIRHRRPVGRGARIRRVPDTGALLTGVGA